ncbi:MAG: hypothetical protein Solivirus2_33 [Solivirus sp.]|uniref:Uncharacterized protein n=1 Tax=Solivirus sp. TaxID=2487772 RepID=A0A3G5AFL0_9VIRU|nr:MAG: hypothetical protein Solivirus2_33 [Solivirus sp.]
MSVFVNPVTGLTAKLPAVPETGTGSSGSDSQTGSNSGPDTKPTISLSSEEASSDMSQTHTFRAEFISFVGSLAIVNSTFISSTTILKYKIEKRSSTETKIESTNRPLIYTVAGNSNSQAWRPEILFESGDYNFGIQFTNETEAKMYSAIIFTLKTAEISNFVLANMLSSFMRVLNYPPSVVFGLKARSATEFVPFDKRIRSDIAKMSTEIGKTCLEMGKSCGEICKACGEMSRVSEGVGKACGEINKIGSEIKTEITEVKESMKKMKSETLPFISTPNCTTSGNTATMRSDFSFDSVTGKLTTLNQGINPPTLAFPVSQNNGGTSTSTSTSTSSTTSGNTATVISEFAIDKTGKVTQLGPSMIPLPIPKGSNVSTGYHVLTTTVSTTSSSNTSTTPIITVPPFTPEVKLEETNEMQKMRELEKKIVEELTSISTKCDSIIKHLTETKSTIVVSDVVEVAAQRNILLAKLTQAENYIEKLEESISTN